MTSPALVSLEHPAGARARVLAGFGFNCFDWTIEHASRPVQVLWQHEDFASGQQRPSGSGIPLLFPFPGRIAGGRFSWNGRQYSLPATDGRGNAIHGFVHQRPWRVIEQTATEVTGEFHAGRDAPELLEQWPGDFRIRVRVTLEARSLRLVVVCDNPGSRPLPCGFGAHPYFRLPLGGDRAANCQVSLPVRSRWELIDLLPTGKRLPIDQAETLQAGRPFSELTLDDVFTDLVFEEDWTTAQIHDPMSGLQLQARYDRSFRECVVYTPPHREAICIEPLTSVPGAILLHEQGIESGLRVLSPGESFTSRLQLTVRLH